MRKSLMVLCIAFACHTAVGQQSSPVTDPDFSQRDAAVSAVQECEACREPAVKITVAAASGITVYTNNTLFYKQSITIATSPTKLIRKIKAELTYFEFQPESDDCFPCNKNSATFGNFANCTILNVPGAGVGTHAVTWTYTPPVTPSNYPGIYIINLPPSVKCCSGTLRWCVRYVIEFDDCSVCSKTVCYEKKKTTSTPISTDPTTNPARQN